MYRLRILSIALAVGCCNPQCLADPVSLTPTHPEHYTVVRGDTLWNIAARFLKNPWEWPRIWQSNPHIKNPHWIYPGDVLVLESVNGHPQLSLQRRGTGTVEEKLHPRIRTIPIEQAIPTIPYEAVRQFLTSPRVVTQEQIESAPYIVSLSSNRLIGGSGDTIYVRGLGKESGGEHYSSYTVFRQDTPLKDTETGEILGYNALYVADAHLEHDGDPSTLVVDRSVREILVGDRLLPLTEEQVALDYYPHPPREDVSGHIIEVLDGVSQIGQYNLVVIDRGIANGLEKGHVLQIQRSGIKVLDAVKKQAPEWITLPEETAGLLMVFRTFDRVSYGIVMKATRAIHLGDLVTAPQP